MKILLHFSYIRFRTIDLKNSTHSFIPKKKKKQSAQPIVCEINATFGCLDIF